MQLYISAEFTGCVSVGAFDNKGKCHRCDKVNIDIAGHDAAYVIKSSYFDDGPMDIFVGYYCRKCSKVVVQDIRNKKFSDLILESGKSPRIHKTCSGCGRSDVVDESWYQFPCGEWVCGKQCRDVVVDAVCEASDGDIYQKEAQNEKANL